MSKRKNFPYLRYSAGYKHTFIKLGQQSSPRLVFSRYANHAETDNTYKDIFNLLWNKLLSLPREKKKINTEEHSPSLLYTTEVHVECMSSVIDFCKQPIEKAGVRAKNSSGIHNQLLHLLSKFLQR